MSFIYILALNTNHKWRAYPFFGNCLMYLSSLGEFFSDQCVLCFMLGNANELCIYLYENIYECICWLKAVYRNYLLMLSK